MQACSRECGNESSISYCLGRQFYRKGASPFLEPPQLIALSLIFILATLELFLVAAYEATFSVLSRSALEKMQENGVQRSPLMIRIYESRHRLRLMARIGEVLGVVALTLVLHFFALPFFNNFYSLLIAALGTLAIFLLVSTPRRLRFEEEGEETQISAIALGFVPLHALLLPLTNLLERLSSGNYTEEDFRAEKEEELRSIVESESETGVLEEGEKEMIQGVFGFHDSIVREVMVPRVDVVAVEQSATLEELIQSIKESGHSRVPLYEETLDNIRGIVSTKDLLQILVGRDDLDLSKPLSFFMDELVSEEGSPPFMREPYCVPDTKKIDELLHDLRSARTRLAIVIDEYGGTAGLLTTEDLVEEIVGEIQDEYDEEEELFYWKETEDTLVAFARMNIDDLNEMLETDLPSEGFETLGGFIYDHLGHIPSERQTFVTNNLEIEILKVDGQRISQVQIKRLPTDEKKDD